MHRPDDAGVNVEGHAQNDGNVALTGIYRKSLRLKRDYT